MSNINNNKLPMSPKDGNFYDVMLVAEKFQKYQELKERGTLGLFDNSSAIENAKVAYEQTREEYAQTMGLTKTSTNRVALAA